MRSKRWGTNRCACSPMSQVSRSGPSSRRRRSRRSMTSSPSSRSSRRTRAWVRRWLIITTSWRAAGGKSFALKAEPVTPGAVPDGGAEARHSLSQRSSLPASRTGREQDAAKGGIAVGALKCATRSGSEIMLPHATVDGFRSLALGGLLSGGDDAYDRARVVFNAMSDRFPAIIVQCVGIVDAKACEMFTRYHNLRVSIRGGGHGVTGNAVCNDGLVIDLSRMRSVRADPVTQTARAEGGATWGDFDRETQAFGLASTGGIVPTTGIAGLTLGGGIGYLNRKYGLACDNLISADVVTADGRALRASAEENADLFWALRGGGGNFGVVTSLEYRVHPVGPVRSEEHTSELQSQSNLVCRLLLEKKK